MQNRVSRAYYMISVLSFTETGVHSPLFSNVPDAVSTGRRKCIANRFRFLLTVIDHTATKIPFQNGAFLECSRPRKCSRFEYWSFSINILKFDFFLSDHLLGITSIARRRVNSMDLDKLRFLLGWMNINCISIWIYVCIVYIMYSIYSI